MKDLLILGSFFSGLVVTSILLTTYWTQANGKGRFQSSAVQQEVSHSYGTLMSAYDVCNNHIKQRFDRILTKNYDDLSSRFDDRRQSFLVFADVGVGRSLSDATNYRVICTVAKDNSLVRLEALVPDGQRNQRYMTAFGKKR